MSLAYIISTLLPDNAPGNGPDDESYESIEELADMISWVWGGTVKNGIVDVWVEIVDVEDCIVEDWIVDVGVEIVDIGDEIVEDAYWAPLGYNLISIFPKWYILSSDVWSCDKAGSNNCSMVSPLSKKNSIFPCGFRFWTMICTSASRFDDVDQKDDIECMMVTASINLWWPLFILLLNLL